MNGHVASFVVRNKGDINTARYQECVFGACSAEIDNECKLIEKCYITIPLRQGAFDWSGKLKRNVYELYQLKTSYTGYSNLAEICAQSVWEWEASSNGGNLSITYKTKKKAGVYIYI